MKALIVDKLVKIFGGLQAVSQVSMSIELGERRALMGPNGAGKTTLFHLISGMLTPTSGRVLLFDRDITDLPMHRRAALDLSQTFQLADLFGGLTVKENVLLALRSFKRSRYVLHKCVDSYREILGEAERLLTDWDLWSLRHARVSNLSYGEQRLLDIMLALVSQPRLLLLDEPTSGLTVSETKAVVSRIEKLGRDVAVLLIEHNVDVALDLADRVTVLSMGKVIAEGTPAEIRQDERVREVYLQSEDE